ANAGVLTDEEVVERVRAGETALFEILMRRYNQRLFRVALSVLGDENEAEDVAQEAHVRAYMHLNQFDGRARFSTWLTKIALHEALARLRNRRRCIMIENDAEADDVIGSLASDAPSPEQEAFTRSLQAVLEMAINALPQAYRSVFMLREVEGLSTAETAECLGISEVSAKVRLHRARALLRREIYTRTGAATASAFQFLGARCDRVVATVFARIGVQCGGDLPE
ncbi:MAG TPA: RNA polymerase sigma factor, partial [Blastocatellia bacterium]|nr:RNA polymerase sigma factor [Blastocatellia bacterium]